MVAEGTVWLSRLLFCVLGIAGVFGSSALKNVTVEEGQDALIPCSLPPNTRQIYQITWFKGSTKYLTRKFSPPSTTKYIKRGIDIDGQNALRIQATVREDSGVYNCKCLYLDSSMSMAAVKKLLLIKGVPIISSTTPSTFFLLQTSSRPEDLIIDCRTTGYPSPTISWERYNDELPELDRTSVNENGSLVIKEATKGDGGQYACVATNEMGYDVENFTIVVLEPPKIIGKTAMFHFNAGVTAILQCISRGNPDPKFTWTWMDTDNNTLTLKDGEEDSRHRVSSVHGNTSSVSSLSIVKITTLDWTTYRCHVQNMYGEDEREMILKGNTNPKPPRILSVKTTHKTAQVEWEFGDDGGLILESLTLQYKVSSALKWKSIQISPPDTTTYTITDLQSDTNYNFRIQAANKLGTSPPSSIYLAKTTHTEASVDALSDGKDAGILKGISMKVLIGGVAGGFLFLLFVILGTLCSIRKMQKRNDSGNSTNSRPNSQQEATEMSAFLPSPPALPEISITSEGATANPLSNSRWEFPRDRVRTSVVLGSGAFGVVMKANASGIKGCVGSLPVAVKIVKETDSETARRDLLAELDLLKLIDPHPNVIGLLGCCTRGDPLMVIVEFCEFGDLQSYLRHCRGIEDKYYQQIYQVPETKLASKDLLSFAIQVARGMAHLASMKVVHRDLAARNILIDDRKVCKVSDFGFARDIYVEDHYTRKTQGGRFPIKWMAIESLLDGVSTTKSDVWSYGVLLWEIVTLGASPYPGMNSQEVINFLQDGYRMDKPKHCSEELYCVMLDCWQAASQRRQTFVEISRHLNKMLTDEREFINMTIYDDHLYVNFDGTSLSLSAQGSAAAVEPE